MRAFFPIHPAARRKATTAKMGAGICSAFFQYESGKGEEQELRAGMELSLAVFPETPALVQPRRTRVLQSIAWAVR
jgi:hypothetical protein